MNYTYATNGIDLLELRQTTGSANDLLTKYTYNTQHEPLTIADAARQTTVYAYNTQGQVETVTNAKNEQTTYSYTNGYLMTVTGPVTGATTGYTYDGFGRVRTVTDSDGYVVTTDYDALDRPTVTTYPDATFQQNHLRQIGCESDARSAGPHHADRPRRAQESHINNRPSDEADHI